MAEHGKDPVTNEDLTIDDLVELKSLRTVRPRPPTLTSIPSLLSVFQNEWDALALETYTLRQHLTQTRQELSHSLYQNDAAVRVIARLSKERDEARDALSKITMNGAALNNGDAMQVDAQELPASLVAKVDATQEKYVCLQSRAIPVNVLLLTKLARLSKTRRKRAVPEGWATTENLQSYIPIKNSKPLYAGNRAVALSINCDMALLGGQDGIARVFSIPQNKMVQEFGAGVGASITDTIWAGNKAIVSTSDGVVKVFENGSEIFSFSGHSGEVTALALHPSGEILASVGVDKGYIFYDLESSTQALQIVTNSGELH